MVRYIFELRKSAKYILVEHARRKWVVRTRNPFLVGEVITYGTGQITFDLWPDEVVKSLNESQIDIGAPRRYQMPIRVLAATLEDRRELNASLILDKQGIVRIGYHAGGNR